MENEAQPEDRWFTEGDLRLHYLDWGNPGATPMVLLHHHGGNAHFWDFFAQNMRQEYRILAVDNRGHGDSSWSGNYSPKQYVADLSKLVDNLGLNNIVLIGHSLGGIVSIMYAASRPDRVAKLVIVDIGPEMNKDGLVRLQRSRGSLPASFSSEDEMVKLMKQIEPYTSEDFFRHQARTTMKHDESGRLVSKHDPALMRADLGSTEMLWQELEKIVSPTLVVRGMVSDLFLPHTSGTMVEIQSAGHGVPADNPEAFEAAVRQFLA
jgi:esterase